MAQKQYVLLTSDVSGDEASETVTFGLDGVAYEIDLTDAEANELRDALSTYVKAGRKTGGSARKTSGNTGRRASRGNAGGGKDYDPTAVRKWAESQGITVSPRGRISGDVLEKFRASGN
jgi:Lsr2